MLLLTRIQQTVVVIYAVTVAAYAVAACVIHGVDGIALTIAWLGRGGAAALRC